jgi:Zn finger protein HypA/HybF involved in hydrogenase expression
MRAVVTCECCGHRQAIARQIVRPEAFNLICHSCEGVLRVEVTVGDLLAAQQATGKKTQPVAWV